MMLNFLQSKKLQNFIVWPIAFLFVLFAEDFLQHGGGHFAHIKLNIIGKFI